MIRAATEAGPSGQLIYLDEVRRSGRQGRHVAVRGSIHRSNVARARGLGPRGAFTYQGAFPPSVAKHACVWARRASGSLLLDLHRFGAWVRSISIYNANDSRSADLGVRTIGQMGG